MRHGAKGLASDAWKAAKWSANSWEVEFEVSEGAGDGL